MNKTIYILRTGGVGDVVLSTVALNVINDQVPGARVVWFGREPANSLIRDRFPSVEVYDLAAGNSYRANLALLRSVACEVDAIVDLQRSLRLMVLGMLSALHFKCSYTTWNKYSIHRALLVLQSRICGRKFRVDFLRKEVTNRYEAMALCTARALKKTGIHTAAGKSYVPDFCRPDVVRDAASIAVCLGAKYEAKALPVTMVEDVIRQVISNDIIRRIFLLGDENQTEHARRLMTRFGSVVDMIDLCGNTTLSQAADVLEQCAYSIANDSGLAHLSEAVNTPVLQFFGPTHQKFGYRPHLRKSRVVAADTGCRPCHKSGNTNCRYGDYACSSMISAVNISQLIAEMQHD
jgi:ADP-heptose:LPS heptosyltransferase